MQNDFGNCSQGSAFIALKETCLIRVEQRDSEFFKRAIQFVDWILTKQRDDMKAICQASFVEHTFDGMDQEDIKFLQPFLTSALRKSMRGAMGNPLKRLEKIR